MKASKVVRPKFSKAILPNAVIREEIDKLTLAAGEAGMLRTSIDTTAEGSSRWRPPLVDEDWHAVCQATFVGVKKAERQICFVACVSGSPVAFSG